MCHVGIGLFWLNVVPVLPLGGKKRLPGVIYVHLIFCVTEPNKFFFSAVLNFSTAIDRLLRVV